VKEVPVEVVVEKEVVKTVEIEKPVIVRQEVVKEVEVIKEVEVVKEVDRLVDPRDGGTLRVVSLASIPNIDPLFSSQFNIIYVGSHIYEGLFGMDVGLNAQPQLVKDWSLSPDMLTYEFTLRDGLTFHNGAAVGADDVVASMNRWLPSHGGKLLNSVLNELVEVDGRSLEVRLNEPLGGLVASLAWAPGFQPLVLPKEIVEVTPNTEALPEESYIGTGPYQFESWTKGDKVTLSRFAEFTSRDEDENFLAGGKRAFLDTIVWLEIPDEETKIAGLETREWDVVEWIGFDFFKRVDKNTDLRVATLQPGNQSQLLFNSNVTPTNNKKVRQAIQAVVDHVEHMTSLGDPSLWRLCPAYFFCGTPLESDVASEFYNERDAAKARRLLEEAGYAGEKVTVLSAIDNAFTYPPGAVLRATLEKVGMNVDLPTLDFTTMASRLGTPEWNILVGFCANWFCGEPLLSSRIGGSKTFGIPGYPELKREFSQADGVEAQLGVVSKMQTRLRDDVWYIPLGQWFPLVGHHRSVRNLPPNFIPTYWNAWLEE
jgi:peptide/nickel transport system substrate-binding protein